jgi:hypothetical protein
MALLAFGRKIYDAQHTTYSAVMDVLRELPRRYDGCTAVVVMRGASSDYEDWVVVRLNSARDDVSASCAHWLAKQLTRRGHVVVPFSDIGTHERQPTTRR